MSANYKNTYLEQKSLNPKLANSENVFTNWVLMYWLWKKKLLNKLFENLFIGKLAFSSIFKRHFSLTLQEGLQEYTIYKCTFLHNTSRKFDINIVIL